MKKFIFAIVALFLGMVQVNAQTMSFENAEIPENGKGSVKLKYETGGKTIIGYGFELVLPEGLSVDMVGNEEEGYEPNWTALDGNTGVNLTFQAPASFGFLPKNTASKINNSGEYLMSLVLVADETLHQGDVLTVQVKKAMMTEKVSDIDQQSIKFEDSEFTVKIVEDRVIFNETDTELPLYTAGQKKNVRMNRIVKANSWSTIVLPFTLTQAKAKAAFGEDVQLAEFAGFDTAYADEDDLTPDGITLRFTTYTMSSKKGMTGGKLFLIKTSSEVKTFDSDEATLVDAVTDVTAADEYETSGKFTGSFVKTIVPEDGLFISGEKFYYSVGKTNIKGFRGWFELNAVVGKETDFGAKVNFTIDGEATSIDGVPGYQRVVEGVYDLSGRKIKLENGDVTKLQKGVYIIDGKKVTIK